MKQNQYFNQDVVDIIRQLNSNSIRGLTIEQIQRNKEVYGRNCLLEKKKQSPTIKFLKQFLEPTTIVLIVAGIVTTFLGEYNNTIAILVLLLVNGTIGFIQEYKAETALQSIQQIATRQTTVIRDGIKRRINVEEIVVGDIVLLETGDYVPADLRLVESQDLQIDESALTGETLPVEKETTIQEVEDLPLAERINMAFMSTLVTAGRGKGVVTAVGNNTEIGHIAQLIQQIDSNKTPLQKQLSEISRVLSIIAIFICFLIFLIGVLQGQDLYDIAMSAFSLAIAAIPEGMPLIVTIILVMGARDMAKHHVIMKNLTAIETAGSSDIILSDKTGTLTQNKMTVRNLYINHAVLAYSDLTELTPDICKLLEFGALNNNATITFENEEPVIVGQATDSAILASAVSAHIKIDELRYHYPRIGEIPFDSDRKRMTTIHQLDNQQQLVIVKGALEILIQYCQKIDINGSAVLLDDKTKQKILEQARRFARGSLRVVAVTYKICPMQTEEKYEEKLIFLGLFAMIDPPKEGVKEAIDRFNQAGIDTVMITGDNVETATSIAQLLGIVQDDSRTISGFALDRLTEEELADTLHQYRVFARVTPEHKLKIMTAFQSKGHVAIMIGDGVNDALALKKADIGVAMGSGGTEVAKGAADMILVDDNFPTISYAICYGRQAYQNIKLSIQFMLSGNFASIFGITLMTIFGKTLFGSPVVLLNAVQILWFNIVSDTLLSVALGMEPLNSSIMNEPPRKKGENFFGNGLARTILINGMLVGFLTVTAYILGLLSGHNSLESYRQANTMAFMTLNFAQFFHAFNLKSQTESVFKTMFSNRILVIVFFISIGLQLSLICIPFVRETIFNMTVLSPMQWLIIFLLSITPVIVVELKKLVSRHKN